MNFPVFPISDKEVAIMSDGQKFSKTYSFCCWYVILGNAAEAAVRAGYSPETACEVGMKLLASGRCRRLISSMRESLSDQGGIISGLRRLAFGSCSDAAALAFADELPSPEVMRSLDLFNVSEIKRVKGGGVEIKFFDRLKALEKLWELENAFSDRDKAAGLIGALLSSAEEGGNDEDDPALS